MNTVTGFAYIVVHAVLSPRLVENANSTCGNIRPEIKLPEFSANSYLKALDASKVVSHFEAFVSA